MFTITHGDGDGHATPKINGDFTLRNIYVKSLFSEWFGLKRDTKYWKLPVEKVR